MVSSALDWTYRAGSHDAGVFGRCRGLRMTRARIEATLEVPVVIAP